MEGRYPTGLLLAMTNCTDPSKSDEFNRWYNHMHIPDVTEAGVFHHAIRFANSDPNSPEGQYVATYETTLEDVSKAMPVHLEAEAKLGDREHSEDRRPYWEDGRTPLLQGVMWGVFKRLGGEFVASMRPALGILLVLTNCKDNDRQEEFNRWYEDVHIPDILDTGAFHAAYRYERVEREATSYSDGPGRGRPPKAQYLAIYETDNPDPAKAREEVAKVRSDWQQRGRLFDGMEPVSLLTARRIWPMD